MGTDLFSLDVIAAAAPQQHRKINLSPFLLIKKHPLDLTRPKGCFCENERRIES